MKTHKIKTIEDLANAVTENNYKCLVLDIASCLQGHILMKKKYPSIKLNCIEWKDDNIIGMSGLNLLNDKGKLIKKFKFKLTKK